MVNLKLFLTGVFYIQYTSMVNKWVEQFKERTKFAGWGPEDQLYHLKIHLDKITLEIFHNLPDSSKTTAESAIAALKKRTIMHMDSPKVLHDVNYLKPLN